MLNSSALQTQHYKLLVELILKPTHLVITSKAHLNYSSCPENTWQELQHENTWYISKKTPTLRDFPPFFPMDTHFKSHPGPGSLFKSSWKGSTRERGGKKRTSLFRLKLQVGPSLLGYFKHKSSALSGTPGVSVCVCVYLFVQEQTYIHKTHIRHAGDFHRMVGRPVSRDVKWLLPRGSFCLQNLISTIWIFFFQLRQFIFYLQRKQV